MKSEVGIEKTCGRRRRRGFTLIELIVATAILVILTGLAIPMARVAIKREREHQLRNDLWEMRDAIDRYKDAADRGAFQIKVGSEGYPPDLDTLVNGVDVAGKKLKFRSSLRSMARRRSVSSSSSALARACIAVSNTS